MTADMLNSEDISASLEALFRATFGPKAYPWYVRAEAPGRVEIAGNHTDHQGGVVISAALDRRIYALAAPNSSAEIVGYLEGFGHVRIDLAEQNALSMQQEELGTSSALVRGMAAEYVRAGGNVQGFDLVCVSDLPAGAGMSSSAAFEVLLGGVLRVLDPAAALQRAKASDHLAPDNASLQRAKASDPLTLGPLTPSDPLTLTPSFGEYAFTDGARLQIALEGVQAERQFFGKACGAQDQVTSAFGGAVFMDFAGEQPQVRRIPLHLDESGYEAILVDTGVDHSRYTADFQSIPADMSAAAHALGCSRLCETTAEELAAHRDQVIAQAGERAYHRAEHYFAEVARVQAEASALEQGDYAAFLSCVRRAGESNEQKLRNVTPQTVPTDDAQAREPQRVMDLCARLLENDGARRMHGGGFGGSVLAFVPKTRAQEFCMKVNKALGRKACMPVTPGQTGIRAWRLESPGGLRDPRRLYWTGESPYGTLEVSINLMKPEKDPRAIAAAAAGRATGCDLCRELAHYDAQTEALHDERLDTTVFTLDDEVWRLHFSEYGYYPLHCIAIAQTHRPMHIDRGCLRRLLGCVERYPFYFMGSNADLPIVGGSILAHDHFQGGGHVFALMKAPLAKKVTLDDFAQVTCGIVRWPASTLRLISADQKALLDAADAVIEAWRAFTYEPCDIVSRTGETQHNTATLIAYKRSFVGATEAGNFSVLKCPSTCHEPADCFTVLKRPSTCSASAPDEPPRFSVLNRPTPCHATPCHEPSQPADSTKPCKEDPFIVDIILRNNRTTPERPYGLFHPDESLHYIKKENIGLIEAMGLAVLPSRLVRELPGVAYNQEVQAQVTQAFVQILRAVGVFKEDEQGKAGWREFLRGIHGEIDE